jgi:hypothetical protein
VLNLAYNALCDGTCLQDLELRRQDEVYLDALGARRIPDPTTAGDFCRRFRAADIHTLIDVINSVRPRIWARQPAAFFDLARIDMDGTLVETDAECKQGIDIAYNGVWGYHPLVVSLANTGEVLSVLNGPGNRPSHEGAAAEVDRAMKVCLAGGFQTAARHILADDLQAAAWQELERPPRYEVKTQSRQKPTRVKEAIVRQRAFENKRLASEDVAEMPYRPVARCDGQLHEAYPTSPSLSSWAWGRAWLPSRDGRISSASQTPPHLSARTRGRARRSVGRSTAPFGNTTEHALALPL